MLVNTAGILSRLDEIIEVVRDFKISVLCATETHVLADHEDGILQIEGYSHYRCDSSSRHTGGVLIYVTEKLGSRLISKVSKPMEYWMLAVKVGRAKSIQDMGVIISCYRSPSASIVQFLTAFSEWLEGLMLLGSVKIMILGDFNLDWIKRSEEYYVKCLKEITESFGLKQFVQESTRVTDASRTTIDLVFSNKEVDCIVLDTPKVTDHALVMIKGEGVNGKRMIKGKIDLNVVEEELKKTEDVVREFAGSIEEECGNLSLWVEKAVKKGTSEGKIVDIARSCPWFTKRVKQARKERDDAYKKFRAMKEREREMGAEAVKEGFVEYERKERV